ncbi:MAG TPA: DUF1697 domain-containing protein [Acidobacteria bacterium]|nr:DUF1697 domain-containing protein [Acidobacteriota bacterium]
MPSQRPGRRRTAETHIALLRGINVGGRNTLPAADDVHLPQTTGLLAFPDRSEDTAHLGSFLLRVDELFATSSNQRVWSRFNFH